MTKPLPPRYFAVDQRLKRGLDSREIAKRLGLSQFHIASTMSRLPEKRIEFERLIRSGAPALTVAQMWGCSRSHVENLRRELSIPHKPRKTVDYTDIDRLMDEGKTNVAITAALCLLFPDIPRRTLKGRVEYRRYQRKAALADAVPYEPCIPPADRPRMNAEATRRRLGMDKRTFERVWLPAHIWTADRGFVEARG